MLRVDYAARWTVSEWPTILELSDFDLHCGGIYSIAETRPTEILVDVEAPMSSGRHFPIRSFVASVVLVAVAAASRGRYEYDYVTYVSTGGSGGAQAWVIQRQLIQKRIYVSSGSTTPDQVVSYGYGISTTVTHADGAGNVLSTEIHTGVLGGIPFFDGTQYMQWMDGKETEAKYNDSAANGSGLLKDIVYAYQQRDCSTGPPCWFGDPQASSAPLHDPRMVSQTTTINGQVSEQDYSYDQYNNDTERDEYDFGTGLKGPLIRATATTYKYYTNLAPGPNILNLPQQRLVCTATGAGCTTTTATAQTNYTYDGTALVAESNIGNHDPAYSTSNLTRGNATTVTQTLNDTVNHFTNYPLSSYYSYDIAGNIVGTWDPRLVVHSYGYADSGVLTSGTTFALPTSVTSYVATSASHTTIPAGTALTANVQYDYNLGKPTKTTDVNGNSTTYSYTNDPLDRLLKITRPDNGASVFTYTDTPGAVNVETAADQNTASDGNLKGIVFYDGLGREWETSKRAASQNIAVCKQYDGRSRLQSVSNPGYSNTPFGSSDTTICGSNATSYVYDGLNRLHAVTAPDTSLTSYKYQADTASHTNETLEIEPGAAGQQPNRLHYADAAGRLKEVDENVTSWQSGSYGFSGQSTLKTTYGYNVLDDVTSVAQSAESRNFIYDSLKRLVQAVNPESGTIKYSYDTSGNLNTRNDANGSAVTFSAYDGMNRVTGKSYTLGTGVAATASVSYGYGTRRHPATSRAGS